MGRSDGADEELHVIAPDGTHDITVVSPPAVPNEGPAWAPGGQSLLFDSGRAGFIHIFEASSDGQTVTQLTSVDGYQGFPSVSPDGTTIAFDNSDADGKTAGLSLMDADGANVRMLVPVPEPPAFDSAPAYSPDGRQIAFIRKRSQSPPNAQEAAFVVNVDGGGLQQLTPWEMDVCRVRWAPDGEVLVFSDNCENRSSAVAANIWTIRRDGSALVKVTSNARGEQATFPDFSPDGHTLVAVAWSPATQIISLITIGLDDGSTKQIYVARNGWFLEWPTWR